MAHNFSAVLFGRVRSQKHIVRKAVKHTVAVKYIVVSVYKKMHVLVDGLGKKWQVHIKC